MRKILSLLLCVTIMLTMGLPVLSFAAASYQVTIDGVVKGHTYDAYQIFSGDLYETESSKTLSNIQFGSGIDSSKRASFLAEFTYDNGTSKVAIKDAETLADAYSNNKLYKADKSTAVTSREFARIASKYISSSKTSSQATKSDTTATITGLSAGYYLVADSTILTDPVNDSISAFMMQVVSNAKITAKTGAVDIEKKVKDIADSKSASMSDWQDSADWDIGDIIPFKITAHLPENLDAYDTYKFVFHDSQSAGLSFKSDSVTVYVAGSKVTSGFAVKTEGIKSGETFNVEFSNIKSVTGAANGAEVRIEYQSELNNKAVIGSTGNPNTAYLEYSSNPNITDKTVTSNTPEDKVTVYTYKIKVNKVDENNNPLKGAGFTLYKKNAAGVYQKVGDEVKGEDLTTFEWKGVDDGEYKLAETTTPAGYNDFDDVLFEVTAAHDTVADDPLLTSLAGGDVFTGTVSDGTLTGKIVNKAGLLLPSTGGKGTRILNICGMILILGAAALYFARKHRQENK